MAKFKIGQKVRVKEWVDMPQDMVDTWGKNMSVGTVGFITQHIVYDKGWEVKEKGKKLPFFCLEQELEPVIRVGEQLLLFEL